MIPPTRKADGVILGRGSPVGKAHLRRTDHAISVRSGPRIRREADGGDAGEGRRFILVGEIARDTHRAEQGAALVADQYAAGGGYEGAVDDMARSRDEMRALHRHGADGA